MDTDTDAEMEAAGCAFVRVRVMGLRGWALRLGLVCRGEVVRWWGGGWWDGCAGVVGWYWEGEGEGEGNGGGDGDGNGHTDGDGDKGDTC